MRPRSYAKKFRRTFSNRRAPAATAVEVVASSHLVVTICNLDSLGLSHEDIHPGVEGISQPFVALPITLRVRVLGVVVPSREKYHTFVTSRIRQPELK